MFLRGSVSKFLLIAVAIAGLSLEAHAAREVVFNFSIGAPPPATGFLGHSRVSTGASWWGVAVLTTQSRGSQDRAFSIYEAGEVDALAAQLRSELTGATANLNVLRNELISHQQKFEQLQPRTDQALVDQAKKAEERMGKFESAILQSLNNFDQRILNQEVLNHFRDEMKKVIQEEVARQVQLMKVGQ